jgi:hypothetical protein
MAPVRFGPGLGCCANFAPRVAATGLDNELEEGHELGDLVQAALAQGPPDAVVEDSQAELITAAAPSRSSNN